eukprot:TRINITY_DN903_c0_g1_i1.p1 TRINITY_DN903_c0_g1~~TRINITY_DN903_c0_g1_i1.p1  ORF type:complete len:830 (+),score=307.04 TRINITY_DN903_c0_g1_i1:40-2529(+)
MMTEVLRSLVVRDGRVHTAGGSWVDVLRAARMKYELLAEQCGGLAGRLEAELEGREPEAVRAVCVVYLWVADLLTHPLAAASVPRGLDTLLPPPPPGDPGFAPLDDMRVSASALEGSNPFLSEYRRWIRSAAARLLTAVQLCGAPPPPLLNSVTEEAMELRRRWAWSVPTDEALEALRDLSPLVEVGAGSGYWASLLRAAGADVVAYDSSRDWRADLNSLPQEGAKAACDQYVEGATAEGGPEAAQQHRDRALVLMWPDFRGDGSFATEALRHYKGDTLVLVGEWQGCSFGPYAAGLSPAGQSLSADAQHRVAADFDRVRCVPLPRWPLHVDCLTVWKRRRPTPLVCCVQQSPAAGRYLTAAAELAPREVIMRPPELAHVSLQLDSDRSHHIDVYEQVREQGRLAALLGSGLQAHGEIDVEAVVLADVLRHGDQHRDFLAGSRAAELAMVVAVERVLHYNGFGGRTADGDRTGLELRAFANASLCNHSCRPSAAIAPRDAVVWALQPLRGGEPVTLSYLDDEALLRPVPERRSLLRSRWGFDCDCRRCNSAVDDVRVFTSTRPLRLAEVAPATGPLEFEDEDGDRIRVAAAAGHIVYSVCGEDRPATRQLRLTGRELEFVDIDRAVDLPLRGLADAVAVLKGVVEAAGAELRAPAEIEVPLCGCGADIAVARLDGAVQCTGCGGALRAEDAAELLAVEAAAVQDGSVLPGFAARHPLHHLAAAAAAAAGDAETEALWRGRAVTCAVGLAEATCGEAAAAGHLGDLYGAWAAALTRAGDVAGAQEAFSAQARMRALAQAPGAAEGWEGAPTADEVAAIAPPQQVLSFLFS